MSNALIEVCKMWNTAILVIEKQVQMGHLFILFILLLLLFIFDKATGLTTKSLALIFFETCEEFSSPGSRVVFNPKNLPYPLVTSHFVLDTTREAIKFPVYWPTPPAINHFLEELLHQKLPRYSQNVALNYIECFSWGSGEVKIRLGCEKFLSFLARTFLTEHQIVLWTAIESQI